MGKKSRMPGRVDTSYPNDPTDLKVHIGASPMNLPSRAKMLSQDTQSQFLLPARLTGFARRLHSRTRTALSMGATSSPRDMSYEIGICLQTGRDSPSLKLKLTNWRAILYWTRVALGLPSPAGCRIYSHSCFEAGIHVGQRRTMELVARRTPLGNLLANRSGSFSIQRRVGDGWYII